MRGKVHTATWATSIFRITPAYAGKRRLSSTPPVCSPDHPRLCGEKLYHCRKTDMVLGSPPPMRGKVHTATWATSIFRITPAYAGKRRLSSTPPVCSPDHPRLCGEKCNALCKPDCRTGSPPPMRGKVVDFDHVIAEDRITPAYAGKSCTQHTVLGNC